MLKLPRPCACYASCLFVLATALMGSRPASAVVLAADGKPAVAIVLADDPIPAERTAAGELADYLEKVAGGTFSIIAEADAPRAGPGIYVGPTRFAKLHGLDPAPGGRSSGRCGAVGNDLVARRRPSARNAVRRVSVPGRRGRRPLVEPL